MVMAWKVLDCGKRIVPWDGEVEGEVYWAILMDSKTGKELEFELFIGVYYSEDGEELGIVEVIIDGAVDFSEIFPWDEEEKIMRTLRRYYGDIFDALRKGCDEFALDI
jgi:hypothetical protein